MKVILFGGTGMVGQGVLRECLLDDRVERVLSISRSPVAQTHGKLEQAVVSDLFDLSGIAERMTGYDTVLYCLGVSSVGMQEPEYRRVTKDLTLSIAEVVEAQCGREVRWSPVQDGLGGSHLPSDCAHRADHRQAGARVCHDNRDHRPRDVQCRCGTGRPVEAAESEDLREPRHRQRRARAANAALTMEPGPRSCRS